MDQCERCEDMGCNDCDNCYLADPCYGCEHKNKDCNGQCGKESKILPCDGKCDNVPPNVENCQYYFMGLCMNNEEAQGACPI